jgi:predicted negative regulator of RcsB-dependent stress response
MNSSKPRKIKDFFEKNEYYIAVVVLIIVAIVFVSAFFWVGNGPVNMGF